MLIFFFYFGNIVCQLEKGGILIMIVFFICDCVICLYQIFDFLKVIVKVKVLVLKGEECFGVIQFFVIEIVEFIACYFEEVNGLILNVLFLLKYNVYWEACFFQDLRDFYFKLYFLLKRNKFGQVVKWKVEIWCL